MRPSWLSRIFALFLLAILAFYVLWLTMDNTGTFDSATDLADLDGDSDLDVLLHNVRQEAEFTAFSVATLWFNQGDGYFIARRLEQGTDGGGDIFSGLDGGLGPMLWAGGCWV